MSVQIPRNAVSQQADDVAKPVTALLTELNLLGARDAQGRRVDDDNASSFGSVFVGPPQSVALIEAGATAAAKWWATGLGATVVATWAAVGHWYAQIQSDNVKVTVLAGAALVTAALTASIAHVIATDVRSRAVAAVATIDARARIAETMTRAAAGLAAPAAAEAAEPADASEARLVALTPATIVTNRMAAAGNTDHWLALAMEVDHDGKQTFWLEKETVGMRVPASLVEFP